MPKNTEEEHAKEHSAVIEELPQDEPADNQGRAPEQGGDQLHADLAEQRIEECRDDMEQRRRPEGLVPAQRLEDGQFVLDGDELRHGEMPARVSRHGVEESQAKPYRYGDDKEGDSKFPIIDFFHMHNHFHSGAYPAFSIHLFLESMFTSALANPSMSLFLTRAPFLTISGCEPISKATAGFPHACASAAGRLNPSHCEHVA